MLLENRKDNDMDTLQQVKLGKISLLQVLVNLLDKKLIQIISKLWLKTSSSKNLIFPNTLKVGTQRINTTPEPPIEGNELHIINVVTSLNSWPFKEKHVDRNYRRNNKSS